MMDTAMCYAMHIIPKFRKESHKCITEQDRRWNADKPSATLDP